MPLDKTYNDVVSYLEMPSMIKVQYTFSFIQNYVNIVAIHIYYDIR